MGISSPSTRYRHQPLPAKGFFVGFRFILFPFRRVALSVMVQYAWCQETDEDGFPPSRE